MSDRRKLRPNAESRCSFSFFLRFRIISFQPKILLSQSLTKWVGPAFTTVTGYFERRGAVAHRFPGKRKPYISAIRVYISWQKSIHLFDLTPTSGLLPPSFSLSGALACHDVPCLNNDSQIAYSSARSTIVQFLQFIPICNYWQS